MSSDQFDEAQAIELLKAALAHAPTGRRARIIEKFILAALGSIPWVGGFLSAAAALKSDEANATTNSIQTKWLEEHAEKIKQLYASLNEIIGRFDAFGERINERLESEEYLNLVRKAFRTWDRSDTEEKRQAVRNLISNAAGTRVCSDDVVRLFIDWLTAYHEAHLAVVRHVYQNPGATRHDVWNAIYGDVPREDSAEADLYRLLVRDLSTGGVIRQARETDSFGRFLKRPRSRTRSGASPVMESAFEDTKSYVLTELGSQFVHYAMTEVTMRISDGTEHAGDGASSGSST
jgi:hypothetical protein